MRVFVAAAVVALTFSGVAVAQPNNGRAPAPTVRYETVDTPDQMRTGGAQDPNEMVCRTITATGSRLGGNRVCHTRAEWDVIARAGRDAANDATRSGLRQTQRG